MSMQSAFPELMGIHLTQVARNGHYMLWSV